MVWITGHYDGKALILDGPIPVPQHTRLEIAVHPASNVNGHDSILALRGVGERRAVCDEVRTYLDRHASVLYTHEEWERRTTVRKMGSGVIEKTIETQINRRMKRQGMSGSIRGARRLGKLRVLYRDPRRWDSFWSRLETDARVDGAEVAKVRPTVVECRSRGGG